MAIEVYIYIYIFIDHWFSTTVCRVLILYLRLHPSATPPMCPPLYTSPLCHPPYPTSKRTTQHRGQYITARIDKATCDIEA